MAVSTASDPEFKKKKEFNDGWGIIGSNFSIKRA
jgi:hypothetical protein